MAAEFAIHPLSRFERAGQTTIRRPREFLYFSFDEKHELKPRSDESLRYYYPPFVDAPGAPPRPLDLTKGFDIWVKGDDSVDNHLDGLVETIQAQEESLLKEGASVSDVKTQADVVTWRGMMTKIMTAPFDIFSDFEMNATCYQGTIYIEENHSYGLAQEQQQHKWQPRPGELSQEVMQYLGYKFESVSTLKKPWAECSREEINSREDDIVNNNIQYCSIVRTGIGNTSLILGGEVDCVLGEKPEDPDSPIPWVELKTTADMSPNNPKERQKFERKMLRFWAQSFLLGVPKIVVGYRNRQGLLMRYEEFETQKIPGVVSRGTGAWNGNVCINFTAAFLNFLKQTIMGQDGVWRIKRAKDNHQITVFKVDESGTGQILKQTFKEHRDKLMAAEIAQRLGGDRGAATGQE